MSHEDMTNTSNDSLDIQIEHNNLPKDFSTQSVQDFINQYYQDICNDNLNVDSYYSPNVNQFITLKNITSDEVAYQINTVAKREFRNTKTKIISDVEQINKDSKNGISYYTFSISLETYRVSKKKNTACNVDIEIGLNPDFKMVSYKELKYYDYKSY